MKKISGLALSLSIAFSAVALAGNSFAATETATVGTKVCVVEIAKVLHDSPQVKKDVELLKAKFKKDQDAIETKQNDLQKDMQDLKKNAAVMSSADKAKKEKTITENRQTLIKEISEFQKKLTTEQKSMMDVVFKKLNGVVQSVAKTKSCDVVLDSQFVLYAVPAQDVTEDVAKAFDAKSGTKQ